MAKSSKILTKKRKTPREAAIELARKEGLFLVIRRTATANSKERGKYVRATRILSEILREAQDYKKGDEGKKAKRLNAKKEWNKACRLGVGIPKEKISQIDKRLIHDVIDATDRELALTELLYDLGVNEKDYLKDLNKLLKYVTSDDSGKKILNIDLPITMPLTDNDCFIIIDAAFRLSEKLDVEFWRLAYKNDEFHPGIRTRDIYRTLW